MPVDTLELVDRYRKLVKEYVILAPELAKSLERFGRLRNELQLLTIELKNRGVDLEKVEQENP